MVKATAMGKLQASCTVSDQLAMANLYLSLEDEPHCSRRGSRPFAGEHGGMTFSIYRSRAAGFVVNHDAAFAELVDGDPVLATFVWETAENFREQLNAAFTRKQLALSAAPGQPSAGLAPGDATGQPAAATPPASQRQEAPTFTRLPNPFQHRSSAQATGPAKRQPSRSRRPSALPHSLTLCPSDDMVRAELSAGERLVDTQVMAWLQANTSLSNDQLTAMLSDQRRQLMRTTFAGELLEAYPTVHSQRMLAHLI